MRIIITGGTGFLGRPLAARLAQDGHEVVVLTRDAQKAQAMLPAGVQAVAWDGRTTDGWGQLVDGAGAVVNLAGASIGGETILANFTERWTAARKQAILQSRLNAGAAVVAAIAAAQHKPAVLLQSSASGYYGKRGDEPLDESAAPANPCFESEVCAQWEQSTAAVDALGVRRVIVRTGVVIDRGGGAFAPMLLPYQLFTGGPLGSGRQVLPWIHRDDWVSAMLFLMNDARASGPVNVCAPQPLSLDEFGRAIGRAIHRPHWLPVPAFALRLLLGEKADILLEGRRAVPAKLQAWGFQFKYPTADQALQAMFP
jgi:uncharacterized protein (TIGR01777 family)